MDYRVQLDIFSGPLDLLLYLVRRHEVDIVDLPVALITAQFLQFLEVLEFMDLDVIGDFIVMASTLVEIKSRQVLPRADEEPDLSAGDEADPRSDLVRQLLEYKKFKAAARLLEEQAAEWQERYPRLSDERPAQGGDPSSDRIKEVELWDLVSALTRVLRRSPATHQTSIIYDDTPISTYVERIYARLKAEGKVAFSDLFEPTNVRSKVVGIFLAVLELLRHYRVRAEQPVQFGEIWIFAPAELDAPVPAFERTEFDSPVPDPPA